MDPGIQIQVLMFAEQAVLPTEPSPRPLEICLCVVSDFHVTMRFLVAFPLKAPCTFIHWSEKEQPVRQMQGMELVFNIHYKWLLSC